jgi:hypothetical protein
MTTYHNGVARNDCIFVPTPMGEMYIETTAGSAQLVQQYGGTMPLWDYYENPVELGFNTSDAGNVYLGRDAGYPGVYYPPQFSLSDTAYGGGSSPYLPVVHRNGDARPSVVLPDSKNVSGALKLPTDGHIFGKTGGWWWVHDRPMFTHGVTGDEDADVPTGYTAGLNGRLVPSSYKYVAYWPSYVNGVDVVGQNGGTT